MDTKRLADLANEEYEPQNLVGISEPVPSDGQLVRCAGCGKIHIRNHGIGHMIHPYCNDCVDPLDDKVKIMNFDQIERMVYELESGEPG